MPYNRALLAKLDKQNVERSHAMKMKAAQDKRPDRKYYVVNVKTDMMSTEPVTMDEFVGFMGPRATRGHYRQFELHEVH